MELKPVRTGEETLAPLRSSSASRPICRRRPAGPAQNTYLLLAVSLVPTAIGAAIGYKPSIFPSMRSSPVLSSIRGPGHLLSLDLPPSEKNRNSSPRRRPACSASTLFLGLLLGPLFPERGSASATAFSW